MKRSPFTLMEVLVGFSLFTVLISTLMLTFKTMSHQNNELERAKRFVQKERFMIYHVTKYFDQIIDKEDQTIQVKPGPQLIFSIGNQVDTNPMLVGELECTLYSKDGQLLLQLQSTIDKKYTKEITLLSNVTSFNLNYTYPTDEKGVAFLKRTDLADSKKLPYAFELNVVSDGYAMKSTHILPADLLPTLILPQPKKEGKT